MKIEGLCASFDIETFGLEPPYARVFGGTVQPWGGQPTQFWCKRAASDDSKVVGQLIEELNKYAILIAHNGVMFDRKMLNARALAYGQPIIDPRGKFIDPVQVARRNLNMSRNDLSSLAEYFELTEQKMHIPAITWVRAALDHSAPDMELIKARNLSDVRVLEELARHVLALVGPINFWGSA